MSVCDRYQDVASNFLAVLGEHDRSKSEGHEVKAKVAQIIWHEQYKGQEDYWRNDIALLEPDECVTFNKYISPVCLPVNDSTADMYSCYSTGWGKNAST